MRVHFPVFVDLVDLHMVADTDIGELLVTVIAQRSVVLQLLLEFAVEFGTLIRAVGHIRKQLDSYHAKQLVNVEKFHLLLLVS